MFTGIIEEIGSLKACHSSGNSMQLLISASAVLENTRPGDSIAVNGVCLTVTRLFPDSFSADVMPETFSSTSLARSKPGAKLNLERALTMNSRIGGHFVSGHVDYVAKILSRTVNENAIILKLSQKPELRQMIVRKGSIALDGTSLTVMDADEVSFTVSLIPHTRELSIIGGKLPGETVNVECDMLARYVAGLMGLPGNQTSLSELKLKNAGFI